MGFFVGHLDKRFLGLLALVFVGSILVLSFQLGLWSGIMPKKLFYATSGLPSWGIEINDTQLRGLFKAVGVDQLSSFKVNSSSNQKINKIMVEFGDFSEPAFSVVNTTVDKEVMEMLSSRAEVKGEVLTIFIKPSEYFLADGGANEVSKNELRISYLLRAIVQHSLRFVDPIIYSHVDDWDKKLKEMEALLWKQYDEETYDHWPVKLIKQ